MHKSNQVAYSAIDIARILVRNPEEVLDLLTYDRICDELCGGRAIESLGHDEKDTIFSLEMAVDDLVYLGFDRNQIQQFLEIYQDAYQDSDIDNVQPQRYVKTVQERALMTAFTVVAFPYGPPIILKEPYNNMANKGFTLSQTRQSLDILTSKVASKLMDSRMDDPTLLLPTASNAHRIMDQVCEF